MFVVANQGRLEMCGVGWVDAYVMGLSRRMGDMCMHHSFSVCVFVKKGFVRKRMCETERKKRNEKMLDS